MIVNKVFVDKTVSGLIDNTIESVRLATPQVVKAICYVLANKNIMYNVKRWPGGIQEITCNVDTCPMCKRKL